METVAIVGVGLIGGSFGLALKKAGFAGKILGVSAPGTLEKALERGAIDQGLPLEQALQHADLVYLSQPISRILETLASIEPWLRPGSLVTDAGSTKAKIVGQAQRSIRQTQFLGGHPLAGKERRGVQEADPDLFLGRTYVLTPGDPSELETAPAREFIQWVKAIGAVPLSLSPQEHDRIVSLTSHLPQLLASALASTLAGRLGPAEHLQVAGPGLRDTIRLASSPYDIWGDILKTNTCEIEAALAAYIAKLEDLRAHLCSERMRQEFQIANEFASRLKQQHTCESTAQVRSTPSLEESTG